MRGWADIARRKASISIERMHRYFRFTRIPIQLSIYKADMIGPEVRVSLVTGIRLAHIQTRFVRLTISSLHASSVYQIIGVEISEKRLEVTAFVDQLHATGTRGV